MQEEAARVRFLRKLDFDAKHLAVSYQVHGKEIHVVRKIEDVPLNRADGIDGWVAGRVQGVSLGVFIADCLPIFLMHREEPMGALIHAGWRGLKAGIVEEAFRALTAEFHLEAGEIVAAIGPHVRSCCYQVGDDVAGQFPESWGLKKESGCYLDLGKGAADKLLACGLEEVLVSTDCTKCAENPLFFSKRRGLKGAQMALLAFS